MQMQTQLNRAYNEFQGIMVTVICRNYCQSILFELRTFLTFSFEECEKLCVEYEHDTNREDEVSLKDKIAAEIAKIDQGQLFYTKLIHNSTITNVCGVHIQTQCVIGIQKQNPNIYSFVTDKPDDIEEIIGENTPSKFKSVDPPNKSRNNVSMR